MFLAAVTGISAAIACDQSAQVIFPSQEKMDRALAPLGEMKLAPMAPPTLWQIHFKVDPNAPQRNIVPLRNSGVGNLLQTEVHRNEVLTVYYPERPRVPHHLAIAFNRDIRGFGEVTAEENAALFATLRKVAEIYKTVGVKGFVLAQYNTPQLGHWGRCVVEVIPHLPGFQEVKNIVDKVESNRHVLSRGANLTPALYEISPEQVRAQAGFWQVAFQREHPPLTSDDTSVTFPVIRKESHLAEAEVLMYRYLLEMFENRGAQVISPPLPEAVMPTQVPADPKEIKVEKCFFCDPAVIKRQLVCEYEDVVVLYNMRKGAVPASNFLILPKRHEQKVYGLSESEIRNIGLVRKALAEVLQEMHPKCEVIVYTQDDPAVGQTVFHSHEQVVAVDPETVALTWTMMSLYPSGNVTPEEMAKVCEQVGPKLEEKLRKVVPVEESA